jgi:hypothetical protein
MCQRSDAIVASSWGIMPFNVQIEMKRRKTKHHAHAADVEEHSKASKDEEFVF